MSSVPEVVEVPPSPPRQADWWRPVGGAAILVMAALAVYWPALRGQFLWDDLLVVHRNPLVTGELGLASIWFRTDFPLTSVAFWLEWLAWGNHPAGYHVVNVLLHATSAMLLWRLLARLRIRAAWLGAMMFAVHPVCVGSVAWISELKNTLSLPFFLLSMLWYLPSGFESPPPDPPPRISIRYGLALLAFGLALLAKTSTVMLPLVLLGSAWWQRGRITRQDGWRASPFFALALIFGLMSIWFQAHGAISGATVQYENFWGRLAGAGMALWFYLGKALLPLKLCMIYPRWEIDARAGWSYLPLLLWCGLLGACWGRRYSAGLARGEAVGRRGWCGHGKPAGCRRSGGLGRSMRRHLLFGLGCFTVTLFPVLGFIDMYFLALSRVSDHFEYLPLIFVVALVAGGLGFVLQGRVLAIVGGTLVILLAGLAFMRAPVFVSEEALWRDTLDRNPAAWCAQANLGWILAGQQKYDEAREYLVASLKINPNNAQAHSNLGRVLASQRQFDDADEEFQAAVRLKPKDAEIRRSYAAALAEQGKKEAAEKQLRELLQLKPDLEARSQLATLLFQAAKFGEAVAEYRQVVAAKPNQPEELSNLAWLLATSPDSAVRNGADAVRFAEQACRLTGHQQAKMLGALAAAYAEAGRSSDAVAATQKAIELARTADDARLVAIYEQLLGLYRAGKPYHMPASNAARVRAE
jgi:tetratricopeptide (TPR) repeat protein